MGDPAPHTTRTYHLSYHHHHHHLPNKPPNLPPAPPFPCLAASLSIHDLKNSSLFKSSTRLTLVST